MRVRLAFLAIVVGVLLLGIAFVHFVTALDMERLEPAQGFLVNTRFYALSGLAVILIFTGTGVLARWSRHSLAIAAGLLLLGGAGLVFISASNTQRQQQVLQDQRWAEDVRRLNNGPFKVLPGAKPEPVPMAGLPFIAGLGVAGGALWIYGLWTRAKGSVR